MLSLKNAYASVNSINQSVMCTLMHASLPTIMLNDTIKCIAMKTRISVLCYPVEVLKKE
jgi:hypothetical protein